MVGYGILGPIGRLDGEHFQPIAAPRQLRLLAFLLVHAGQAVSTDQLLEALWDGRLGNGAGKRVQMAIARLRKALDEDADALRTVVGGYVLALPNGALDAGVFEDRAEEGRRALEEGDEAAAADLLAGALRLWRGPALAEVRYEAWAQGEIRRLEELRIGALEWRVEADLRLGRHAALIGELEALTAAHPGRERLAGQLMLALYRSGRQGDALAAYQRTRAYLATEQGLEPGPTLRTLQEQILAQSGALGLAAPGGAAAESRRLVSVLAARAEVHDPEVLHGLLDRCAAVVEQHGGTVEPYPGDALVGLFGLRGAHGDPALRAALAATQLREAEPEIRLAIESGEVFLGSGRRGAIVTGAAISAASRLAERAAAGEILVGDQARPAVARHASVDPHGPLIRLKADALPPPPPTPFVGRSAELQALETALQQAQDERSCQLVTVVGPPGIGKSRLVGEFAAALGTAVTALGGRCLPSGEGTAYRPLADLVHALGDDPRARVHELLGGDEQAVRGILGAVGLSDETAQAQETAWAFRRLLERLARDRPVLVVIEDIHWAQQALLDLLDHVAALSAGAPLLLVCLTRPDLLETNPRWAAPQPRRTLLLLDPLHHAHALELAQRLGAGAQSDGIARRAEGNPLFVEHLVSAHGEESASELPVSIHAVLAARIDALEERERTLLRCAAVEGRTFHLGAVRQEGDLAAPLVALARRGLISPDRPLYAGEEAYRFTHALVRDAAYAGLPKRARSALHEDLADWLEQRDGAADEVVGFHLEQACLLARELRGATRRSDAARRAIGRFETASRAALARAEPAAAVALIERALALAGPERAALLPALGETLFEAGRLEEAARVLDEAPTPRARVEREFVRLETEPGLATEQAGRVAAEALPLLEHDAYGRCRAWCLRAQAHWSAGRIDAADAAWETAAELARDDDRVRFDVLGWRATAAVLGRTPVDEAIRRCEHWSDELRASPVALAWILNPLASLHALRGDAEPAQRYLDEASATLARLGGLGASVTHHAGLVLLLTGQPDRAAGALRAGMTSLTEMGDRGGLATTTAMLAQAEYALERLDEADELCRRTAETAAPDDIVTQVIWRGVLAKVLARRGDPHEAETLAREAIRLVEGTDLITHHADALLDLGDVLRIAERSHEVFDVVMTGLRLYEAKGNAIGAARAQALLQEE
jgi:DNA-binding SARP family transcriptional activator